MPFNFIIVKSNLIIKDIFSLLENGDWENDITEKVCERLITVEKGWKELRRVGKY